MSVRDTAARINRFWRRNLRNYFERWKDKILAENKAIKIMDKYFSKNRVSKHRQAFTKWKYFVIE